MARPDSRSTPRRPKQRPTSPQAFRDELRRKCEEEYQERTGKEWQAPSRSHALRDEMFKLSPEEERARRVYEELRRAYLKANRVEMPTEWRSTPGDAEAIIWLRRWVAAVQKIPETARFSGRERFERMRPLDDWEGLIFGHVLNERMGGREIGGTRRPPHRVAPRDIAIEWILHSGVRLPQGWEGMSVARAIARETEKARLALKRAQARARKW